MTLTLFPTETLRNSRSMLSEQVLELHLYDDLRLHFRCTTSLRNVKLSDLRYRNNKVGDAVNVGQEAPTRAKEPKVKSCGGRKQAGRLAVLLCDDGGTHREPTKASKTKC